MKQDASLNAQQSLPNLLSRLRSLMPVLSERYRINSLALFGSYVRSEQKEGSDVDILVEFSETPSLLEFMRLEQFLSDSLGLQVDLVMKSALKPTIGRRITGELVPV
jgi:predicted nucleotidyltransferase